MVHFVESALLMLLVAQDVAFVGFANLFKVIHSITSPSHCHFCLTVTH